MKKTEENRGLLLIASYNTAFYIILINPAPLNLCKHRSNFVNKNVIVKQKIYVIVLKRSN